MPSHTTTQCLPAGFLITIYVYHRTEAPCWPPNLSESRCKKLVFFEDIIDASTKEEARSRAIAQFWENMCNSAAPGIDNVPQRIRCLTDLPKHFYIDTQPIYEHMFRRAWQNCSFIASQKRFDKDAETVFREIDQIIRKAAAETKR
jgi:hypothetical protein